jgi:purine-binding chemotaxis protein CheW
MLTFKLGEELFAVDILRVQEIRGWSEVTRIPRAPSHVLGVLNLRGSIVPIIDLRLRFGLERAEFTALTVIIVLSVPTESSTRELGLVVDSVSDVVGMRPEDLRELPDLGNRANSQVISGIASIEKRMVILLDVGELMAMQDPGRDELQIAAA